MKNSASNHAWFGLQAFCWLYRACSVCRGWSGRDFSRRNHSSIAIKWQGHRHHTCSTGRMKLMCLVIVSPACLSITDLSRQARPSSIATAMVCKLMMFLGTVLLPSLAASRELQASSNIVFVESIAGFPVSDTQQSAVGLQV